MRESLRSTAAPFDFASAASKAGTAPLRSRHRHRLALVLIALLPMVACSVFEDNGTHLAYALEAGAKRLQSSGRSEEVIAYEPLSGIDQSYYVELTPSNSLQPPFGGYLVVSGRNSGGTSYHGRFVYTPTRFYVVKQKAAAQITLRKNGGRIEVVDVR